MSASYGDSGYPGGGVRLGFPSVTPAVKKLLIANFAVFFGVFFLGMAWLPFELGVYEWLGLNPAQWRELFPFVPIWQLLTYGFLHGSLGHVFFNMIQLYFFGTMVEGTVGSRRFTVFYAAAILVGGAAQMTASLIAGDSAYTIGASGGALGVVVAAAVMQPESLVLLLFIPIKLKWLALALVGFDVFALLSSFKANTSDNVAHWAHLGGAALGFLAVRQRWIWLDPVEKFSEGRVASRAAARHSDDELMDALLQKISREGMSALSKRERETLKRISSRR